jgi:cytochrome o ubiquinol oxidase subunit 2
LIRLRPLLVLPLAALLSGCNFVLLNPAGDVAVQQRDVLLASVGLMLLIVLPVMALTVFFAWRYRQSAKGAAYDPDWHHSTALEVGIWSAPLAIIVALGALTWVSTHLLDPYRPIGRIAPGQPVAASTKPLRVEVVALDWKWLFIYPDLGIASINELAAPVNTPLEFKITSSHMMNSFFAPAMAGQIYAMPGMETPLHAVMNKTGDYEGFSSNYTGAGFSDMRFRLRSLSAADFQAWVAKAKAGGGALDGPAYLQLEKPSQKDPAHTYASVQPDLYTRALNECVDPKKMCMDAMMRADAKGGTAPAEGHASAPPAMSSMPGMDMGPAGQPPHPASGAPSRSPAAAE